MSKDKPEELGKKSPTILDLDKRQKSGQEPPTVLELQCELFRQEHRFFSILYNFFWKRNTFPNDDPRREAITSAVIWRFVRALMPAGAAVSIGAAGVAGVFLAWHANSLIATQNEEFKNQNQEIKKQNEIVARQTELVSEQITLQKSQLLKAEVANLRQQLYAWSSVDDAIEATLKDVEGIPTPDRDAMYRRGPSVLTSSGHPLTLSRRRAALLSLVGLRDHKVLDLRHSNLRGLNLGRLSLANLDLTGADLTYASLLGAELDNVVLDGVRGCGVDLRRAVLRGCSLKGIEAYCVDFKDAHLVDSTVLAYSTVTWDLDACRVTNSDLGAWSDRDGVEVCGRALQDPNGSRWLVSKKEMCRYRLVEGGFVREFY